MKRCPKCHLSYADDTLEFCLEDGARLIFGTTAAGAGNEFQTETPTVAVPNKFPSPTERTVNLPFSNPAAAAGNPVNAANNVEFQPGKNPPAPPHPVEQLKEQITGQSHQVLELAPLVVSLAHNWWQWVYLSNQYYSSFSSYILSANFLMWLLLLGVGTAISLLALRRCRNKSFAVAGLVILAINLLLILVPKR
jgi:hypothetical protein